MPAWRREVPLPRLWFLTVRMVEVATLALVLGAGLELWEAFRASGQFTPDGGDGGSAVTPVPFMRRVVALAFYSGLFRAPLSLVLAAFLLAGAVAVLAERTAGAPRAAAALGGAGHLGPRPRSAWWCSCCSTPSRCSATTPTPATTRRSSPAMPGPGLVEQAAMGLSWPVGAALVMAAVGLWWLRLPADPDAGPPDRRPHRCWRRRRDLPRRVAGRRRERGPDRAR